jgi:hypothetical protein
VAGHGRGVGEHGRLVDPALGVHVGRQGPEVRRVRVTARRDQDADAERRERVDRGAVDAREEAHRAGHAAEGEVHERAAVAVPPVGQRRGRGRGGIAEAQQPGLRLRAVQRGRGEREVRAGGRGPGGQAEPLAHRRERVVRRAEQPGLEGRRADPDRDVRDPRVLRGERAREFRRLGEHDVGPPLLAQRHDVGQGRLDVHAGEELGEDAVVGLVGAEVVTQRGEDRGTHGRVARREPAHVEAAARDGAGELLPRGEQHFAAVLADRVGEGEERAEVARRA